MRLPFVALLVGLAGQAAPLHAVPPAEIETINDIVITRRPDGGELHAKIRFPKDGGSFPVVIFSHSIDFDRQLAPELSRHWASHGYVTIHPTHVEAAFLAKDSPHARDPRIWFNRLRDMTELLDALSKPDAIDPRLRGKLDVGRIGLAGHSLGGHTSVLLAGATLHHEGKERTFRDPRVRAALIVFPVEPNRYGLVPDSWATIAVPLMIMSGPREWQKWGFDHCTGGNKYHVAVAGASYFSFVNEKSSSSSPAIMAAAQHASLRFWDAHLKNDESATKELRSGRLAIQGGAVTLSSK